MNKFNSNTQTTNKSNKSYHEQKPLIFVSELPLKKKQTIKRILLKYYHDYDLDIISEDGSSAIDDFMNSKISSIVGISADYEELNKIDYICQVFGGYKITAIYDGSDFQYTTYNFGK